MLLWEARSKPFMKINTRFFNAIHDTIFTSQGFLVHFTNKDAQIQEAQILHPKFP